MITPTSILIEARENEELVYLLVVLCPTDCKHINVAHTPLLIHFCRNTFQSPLQLTPTNSNGTILFPFFHLLLLSHFSDHFIWLFLPISEYFSFHFSQLHFDGFFSLHSICTEIWQFVFFFRMLRFNQQILSYLV